MGYVKDSREDVKNFLQQLSKDFVDVDGAMNTSFVLVSEWVNSSGEYVILTITDEGSPAWRHEGLLNYAIANEIYETAEDESEDDDA